MYETSKGPLRLIWIALLVSQVLFLAVIVYLRGWPEEFIEFAKPATYLGGILCIGSMAAAANLFKNRKEKLPANLDEAERFEQYRRTKITQWALLEMANLVNLVLFLTHGKLVFMAYFVAGVLIHFTLSPKEEEFELFKNTAKTSKK